MSKRVLVLFSYPLSPHHDGGSKMMATTLEILRGLALPITFANIDLSSSPEQTTTLAALEIDELTTENTPSLDAHLEQYGSRYDVIWLVGVSSAMRCLRVIRTFAPRAKLVFETTDLQHVRLYRRAKLASHTGLLQMALKTKQWEIATANAAHLTLVVSAEEYTVLRRGCPTANLQVHGLAYPVQADAADLTGKQGTLFVGSFPHHPNQDAMEYYLDKIHPQVQARLDAPLYVVGPQPPAWLVERATEKIRVTGHVPDLAPYLQSARVSIAPLRYGAGVKSKVIESLSYGVPVVATNVAVEGIPVRNESDVLIADTPHSFAGAVVRLHGDDPLWRRLSANALDLVRREYSYAAAQKRIETFLTGLELL